MRRIGLLTAELFAATLHASPHTQSLQRPALTDPPVSPPPQTPPPIFRGGTNRVQVDAFVTDEGRRPVVDLAAADSSCSTTALLRSFAGAIRRGAGDRFRTVARPPRGPLTDLPLTPAAATPELRLALGNLGPGDYVIELALQYIPFRVVR